MTLKSVRSQLAKPPHQKTELLELQPSMLQVPPFGMGGRSTVTELLAPRPAASGAKAQGSIPILRAGRWPLFLGVV